MSRFCNKRPGYIKHGWVICKLNCACSSVLLKWITLVICTLVATEFLIYIFENALLKWVFWMSRHTDLALIKVKLKREQKNLWNIISKGCVNCACATQDVYAVRMLEWLMWEGEKGQSGVWGECLTSGDGLLKTSPTGDYSSVTSLLYSSQQVCFIQCFRYSLHKPATGVAGYNDRMNTSSQNNRATQCNCAT